MFVAGALSARLKCDERPIRVPVGDRTTECPDPEVERSLEVAQDLRRGGVRIGREQAESVKERFERSSDVNEEPREPRSAVRIDRFLMAVNEDGFGCIVDDQFDGLREAVGARRGGCPAWSVRRHI